MWGITAMTKGTSMKDKKKRAGGGGGGVPSTGTYPSVVSAGPSIDIGAMAMGLNPAQNHLHASVLMRMSIDAAGFLQITDAQGAQINSQGAPEVEIADYIATIIQSETPINGVGGNPMHPGVIHTQGAPTNGGVTLVFRVANDEPTGAFGGGEFLDITMVSNPQNVTIRSINGNPPAQVAFARRAPFAEAIVEFDPLFGGETIILEFKMTGSAKAGNFSSDVITPPVSGSTLKVGSCYVQIVFN
jgi:hypothetical protein